MVDAASSLVVPLPGLRSLQAQVDASARLWMVNVCRDSCGFCQQLAPEWELLARKLKHAAHVAFWDADVSRPTAALGPVNTTPAIRALVPRVPGAVAYDGVPKSLPLAQFATRHMPSRVLPIDSEEAWAQFEHRARGGGGGRALPRVLTFLNKSSGAATPPLLRALSVDFGDRLLIGEARLARDADPSVLALARRFDVEALPAMLALVGDDRTPLRFDDPSRPTFDRLQRYLHAVLDTTSRLEPGGEAKEEL